jgi:hypothetical protein
MHNLIYYFPVDARVALLRHLHELLAPRGRLVLTTFCRGSDTAVCAMDLWSSMTEGCGPLPELAELRGQLGAAGFEEVRVESLLPSYALLVGEKRA